MAGRDVPGCGRKPDTLNIVMPGRDKVVATQKRLSGIACTVSVLLLIAYSGCASRPDEQYKLAAEAMNKAIAEQAEMYAPSDWKSAKEIWDQAQSQLAQENYSSAAASLTTAKARFLKASDIAKDERETRETEVKAIRENIANYYTSLKAALSTAKISAAARKEFQGAMADVEKELANIETLVNAKDFYQAKKIGQECLQRIIFNEKKLKGQK